MSMVSEKMLMEYFNYLSAINNTTYNVNVAIDQGTERYLYVAYKPRSFLFDTRRPIQLYTMS